MSITDFSTSVAVGHAWTQAPHDTHSEFEEGLHLPRRNPAAKTAPIDREGKGSLDFLASTDATVADDAFRRIVAEIRVQLVLLIGEVIGPRVAVAHIAQPDVARLRL